ncbi:hypothetical protein NpNSSI1_00006761 [Neofusicoccum parvum]|uniref:Uncharacterized protein n=1 Tax=Neofusicoccum parvum TaxID=310453 RepID=A0ACB5SNC5_9PEZI|nr:hypothetical protein NpNSSI1_00006761 [Neofusicoccum parvum]GME49061.1 hypothetical protein NpPPO83_00004390 [Neofusicoccum parvum]
MAPPPPHLKHLRTWTCPISACKTLHADRSIHHGCSTCGWDLADGRATVAAYVKKGGNEGGSSSCMRWACPNEKGRCRRVWQTRSVFEGCSACNWGMFVCRRCGGEFGETTKDAGCPNCWWCL